MVSADNINIDCLELIFAYLSGNDLVSVSLVSRSFLAGVIPHLYRSLCFHTGNSKRYPKVPSPFDIILQHPNLAVHVRSIDIRTVPLVKMTYHPKFLTNCRDVIRLCTNLRSFICTPNVVYAFLPVLEAAENMETLRINATLTPAQAKHLMSLKKLRNMSIDCCSWNVVDAFPAWAETLQSTLTTLTFFAVHDLDDKMLHNILIHLPQLTSLHVMGCTKVEHTGVLQSVACTPNLKNLSITAWDSRTLPTDLPSLPHLQHLTLDTHVALSLGPSPIDAPALWKSIVSLTHSWSCPLRSITFRLSDKWPIQYLFVRTLVNAHGPSLRHIALLDCELEVDSISLIASKCPALERLAVYVPKRNLRVFASSLSHSKSLKVLSDVGESHTTHGTHAFLTRRDVQTIMGLVPSLQKVATDGRIWTSEKRSSWAGEITRIKLERRRSVTPAYWFLPPIALS